jgi:hypothetical protein
MKSKWWLTSRTTQNTISKHKNCTIFPLILRERDAQKTRFEPAKTQKMTSYFRTLEFKILRLFMMNKWWLTSRTIQNTTSKHKNCTIFPLIPRERDADKTRSGRWNSQFWGYLWRTTDGSHPEPHKTRLRTKIAPFFFLSSVKEMLIKRVQDIGIQYIEVIYKEQVMAHIQNHTKHDFET